VLHLLLVEDESGGVGEGVVLLHDGERRRGRVRHRPVLHRRAASSGPASCSPRKHGQDRKRLKHCQEIRNRNGARNRTQTRNQSGRRNSPVVAKNFREDLIPWRKEKKFLAREVSDCVHFPPFFQTLQIFHDIEITSKH